MFYRPIIEKEKEKKLTWVNNFLQMTLSGALILSINSSILMKNAYVSNFYVDFFNHGL